MSLYRLLRKRENCSCIKKVSKARFGENRYPIQTSLNPRKRLSLHGLETDAALAEAKCGWIYSRSSGSACSFWKYYSHKKTSRRSRIGEIIAEHEINDFDWANNYRVTLSKFWGIWKK